MILIIGRGHGQLVYYKTERSVGMGGVAVRVLKSV